MNKEALKADLAHFSVAQVLYFLSMNKKTGRLKVKAKHEGEIYVEEGKCTHASMNEIEGLDALFELSLLTEGSLSFEPDVLPEKKTMSGETGKLFEEVEKRSKEIRNLENKLPPLDAVLLKSENPPDEKLKLRKNDWKVLSLVDGKRPLREIIFESGIGVFEAYKSLSFLIEKGLIFDPEEGKRNGERFLEFLNAFLDEYSRDAVELKKSGTSFIKTSLKNAGFNEIEKIVNFDEEQKKIVSAEEIILSKDEFEKMKSSLLPFFEKKFILDFGKILGKKKFENFKRRISE